MLSRKGRHLLRCGKAVNEPAVQPGHDREKRRFLDLRRPFLAELGVTDAQHQPDSGDVAQVEADQQVRRDPRPRARLRGADADGPVRVVDFGCGKAYLTFAVHDYLQQRAAAGGTGDRRRTARRPGATSATRAAQRLGLAGLAFEQGDVRTHSPGPVDVMIALHACDTATDHAIHRGIRSGASIIMCSPCCHKQLRPQMHSPRLLQPMLQHGIHLGQEAEMVTDSLRALLLEAQGYETQVFEFVSLEHTARTR